MMSKEDQQSRRDQAKRMRAEGMLLKDIGKVLGVTMERARQLLIDPLPRTPRVKKPPPPRKPRIRHVPQKKTGIKRGRPFGSKEHRWTAEEDAMFDTMPIFRVAEIVGVSYACAGSRKYKLMQMKKGI